MPRKKSIVQGTRSTVKKSTDKKTDKTRRLKQPKYRSFKYSKRLRQTKPPITGAFRLFVISCRFLIQRWRQFGGITLVYFILTAFLVTGLGQLVGSFQDLFQGQKPELATSWILFGLLFNSGSGAETETAAVYQSLLTIIISLVIIWTMRTTSLAKDIKTTVKDAFYKGLYPLVPFVLVLAVIGLQLFPMLIATYLYIEVIASGLAVTAIEQVLWIILSALLAVFSLYMVSSSVFALYIVTLPDLTPIKALRSARDLVRHRRWVIMRKLIFLPIAVLSLIALIILPVIFIYSELAVIMFSVLNMVGLVIGHSYLYHLYRELL